MERTTNIDIKLRGGPVVWLRMYPKFVPTAGPMELSTKQMMDIVRGTSQRASIDPFFPGSTQSYFRRADGVGIYVMEGESTATSGLAVVFENGELWAADTSPAEYTEDQPGLCIFPEDLFFDLMKKFIAVYRDVLRVELPWVWQAGISGLHEKQLIPWSPPNAFRRPATATSLKEQVVKSGAISSPDARPKDVLRPFVEAVYDAFASQAPEALFN